MNRSVTTSARLHVARPDIGPAEIEAVMRSLAAGEVSAMGAVVGEFEQAFARFCGVPFAVTACNGTASLHLALAALGIGPGDEVIVPNLTYIATANAVTYTGASVVFADCSLADWQLDPAAVAAAVTPRTRALLPVHLYGHPAPMSELQEIADRHDLLVVEDAAQAHGARLGDRLAGNLADAGSFSFYGNKVITSGEGGMATFRDPEVDAFARRLRNQGTDPGPGPLHHSVVGFNYRMTSLQAAVGFAQLGRIDDILVARGAIDRWYRAALAALPLEFQPRRAHVEPVLWMFVVLIDDDAGISLDDVQAELRNRAIDTRRMYQPITSFPPYARPGSFPATDEIARRGLVLPTFVGMTEGDVLRVADALKAVLLRA